MSIFNRTTSLPEHVNDTDDAVTQPTHIIEVADASGVLVTVDTTHWPAGWDEDSSRTRVPAELLAYYQRGGNHELAYSRELLTLRGRLPVTWGDSDAADLDVNDPTDRVLALHSVAMRNAQTAYLGAVFQRDQDARNRAEFECEVCGRLLLPHHVDAVEVVKLADRVRKVHLCRQCRSVAYAETARTVAAELLPDDRTRGEAVREWMAKP